MSRALQALAHAVIAALVCLGAARGDEMAEFYRGKTVSVVVGHEVGTGFDVYARALARHVGRHIPGNPNIVVQNMVGASGVVAASWLSEIAPKDGTVMTTFVHTVPFEPLFGNKAARFDPAKMSWIGNMEESIGLCGISKDSGITRFEDLLTRETVFGATGATGPLGKYALAIKNLVGAKLKVIHGYKGSASVKVAMQRGEVHGICGIPLSTVKSSWRDDYQSGQFKPVVQLSGNPHPELKGIPHIESYAKTDEDRQVFGLIFGTQVLGRPFASPPGQPPARTAALRAALMRTMQDAEFLADAARMQIDIEPMSGEAVEALIARFSSASPTVVERARKAFNPD